MRDNDGYIEVKDRANDIIVLSSGDSAITVDVESVLFSHPAILEAAVVGGPDGWCYGEISPCAFVKDIIKHCRDRLPPYTAPQTVVFDREGLREDIFIFL